MAHIKSPSNNSNKPFFCLKKATQILLSVSVFSFLFSRDSTLSPLLDYVISNCSVKLFTCTTERNYVFLLCNGILVLILQSSGVISKITPVPLDDQDATDGVRDRVEEVVDRGVTVKSMNADVGEVEAFEEKEVGSNHGEMNDRIVDSSGEEVEGGDEDEEEGLSTDELNKKCEDFIKKMKQELHRVQVKI